MQDDIVVARWKGRGQGSVEKGQWVRRKVDLVQGFLGVVETFVLDGRHSGHVSHYVEVGMAILSHIVSGQCFLFVSPAATAHAADAEEHHQHNHHRTCHTSNHVVV